MADTGPEKQEQKKDPFEKKEDLFTPTGELKGGYDTGMARAYALEHAKKTQGEYVGHGKGRRLLVWQIESSRFDEDAECWEVVLSCQPEEAQVERPGRWVYHVRATGGLMPGTPIQQQSLRYIPSTLRLRSGQAGSGHGLPKAPRRRRPRLPIVGAGATLAIVAVVGALLFLGGRTPANPGGPTPVAAAVPPATPTPTATPVPASGFGLQATATPTPRPTPTPMPKPTPTPTPAQPGQVMWTSARNGLFGGYVCALALSPAYATDRTLYAGTWGGGVFRGVVGP